MMRRNLALVLTLALITPAALARDKARRRLDQMTTTKERWNELMNSENLEDDKPKREVIRIPARAQPPLKQTAKPAAIPAARAAVAARPVPGKPATAVKTAPRGPASVQPMSQAPPASALPVAAITFDEYLQENGRNPSLSKKIPDQQSAFVEIRGPAVISMPDSENSSAANPQQSAFGANPAALQSAAAAAAAAGLLPAAGVGAAGTGAAQPVQQQNTGAPIR